MQYRGAVNGLVQVQLTADECQLIGDAIEDGSVQSDSEDPNGLSIQGGLCVDFRALARVARMTSLEVPF